MGEKVQNENITVSTFLEIKIIIANDEVVCGKNNIPYLFENAYLFSSLFVKRKNKVQNKTLKNVERHKLSRMISVTFKKAFAFF